MFENNNNNRNQISVNTTFITWYCDMCKFSIGGWNDKLSLRFTLCTGKDSRGINVYDRNQEIQTALSQEKAVVLYNKIRRHIIPLIENNSDTPKSVGLNTNSGIVRVGREPATDGGMVNYISFSKGMIVDGTTSSVTQVMKYVFQPVICLIDDESGQGVEEWENGQFDLFCAILRDITMLLPIVAHAERYSAAIRDLLTQKYGANNSSSGPLKPSDIPMGDFNSNFMLPGPVDDMSFTI